MQGLSLKQNCTLHYLAVAMNDKQGKVCQDYFLFRFNSYIKVHVMYFQENI